ncbi:MAG: sigma-70 family RNA polymerase sigma factor [Actinomycetota bacterium]
MPSRRTATQSERKTASDDELVAACLAGDEHSWVELISRYAAYIYAIATRAFGLPPAAAEEVFQDACIRVYEGLAGFSGRGEFRSWLRAVVLSAAREHLRKEARRPEVAHEVDPGTEAELEELETALDVRAAVLALGEPCNGTIGLYFFRNLTQAEVAESLGVPPGTVAARLSRCLKRLRDALQESGPPEASRG